MFKFVVTNPEDAADIILDMTEELSEIAEDEMSDADDEKADAEDENFNELALKKMDAV